MKSYKTEKYDSDIEIINAILRVLYGGERRELADKLMQRFGSFHAIFRAAPEDLLKVDGVTDTAASFFSAAVPQFRQALRRAAKNIKPRSEYDLVNLALATDDGSEEKSKRHIYLDGSDKIIKCEKVVGPDSVKKTVGAACGLNAAKVAVVEYGRREKRVFPDEQTLKYLSETIAALEAVGILFVDQIDFSGYKFNSLRRVISGGAEYVDLQDAKREKYEKVPNFGEIISEYAKKRTESTRIEILAEKIKPDDWDKK